MRAAGRAGDHAGSLLFKAADGVEVALPEAARRAFHFRGAQQVPVEAERYLVVVVSETLGDQLKLKIGEAIDQLVAIAFLVAHLKCHKRTISVCLLFAHTKFPTECAV